MHCLDVLPASISWNACTVQWIISYVPCPLHLCCNLQYKTFKVLPPSLLKCKSKQSRSPLFLCIKSYLTQMSSQSEQKLLVYHGKRNLTGWTKQIFNSFRPIVLPNLPINGVLVQRWECSSLFLWKLFSHFIAPGAHLCSCLPSVAVLQRSEHRPLLRRKLPLARRVPSRQLLWKNHPLQLCVFIYDCVGLNFQGICPNLYLVTLQ